MAKDIICKRRGRENAQEPTEGEDYLMTMRKRTRSNSRRGEEQRKTRRNCA
jgi:hypothetical protein